MRQLADQSRQIAEDLKNARIKAIEAWESKLQSSLLQAISDEQKYAAEVIRLQQELSQAKMSTEEKVRELRRRTMTEEEAWIDRQKQAYETLRQAQQAIADAKPPEQLKAAMEPGKKAQEQFACLAGEVKEGHQVIKTEAETTRAAIKGVEEAGKLVNQSIEKQIQLAKDNHSAWQTTADQMQAGLKTVKEQIDTISNTPIVPTVDFKIDQSSLSDVERVREDLAKPITVKVNYASSGGGGSNNSMRVNIPNVVASAMPALPELPKTAFATGGAVSSGGEYGTLRLQAGGVELPVMVQGRSGRQMVKDFEKEL